jgi:peptidoglycan/LPS O-acetylase OafA/YrhL
VHIYYSPALAEKVSYPLFKFEKTIRYFAAASFALYLFHRPIIQFVAAISPVPLTEITYYISQWVIVFLIVLPLSKFCDNFKNFIKKWMNDTATTFKEFK